MKLVSDCSETISESGVAPNHTDVYSGFDSGSRAASGVVTCSTWRQSTTGSSRVSYVSFSWL